MIGIIGAMEEEVQALRHAMKIQEEKEIASMVFHRGILYGKEAVVVRSGIGKVNAAICTQILADHFDVDLVINTGIAGSLDAAIDIGVFSGIRSDRFRVWIHLHSPQMHSWSKRLCVRTRRPIRISIHLPDGSPVETSLFPHRK